MQNGYTVLLFPRCIPLYENFTYAVLYFPERMVPLCKTIFAKKSIFHVFYAVLNFHKTFYDVHATLCLMTSGKSIRMREVASSILLICNAPGTAPGTPQTATRPPGDSPPRAAGLRLLLGPRALRHVLGELTNPPH